MAQGLPAYVARRVVLLVPVILLIVTVTFAMSYAIPGNPVYALTGQDATGETLDHLIRQYGLDQPVYVQFFAYLRRLISGDLGWSLFTKRPVWVDLKQFFPATLELAGLTMIVTLAVGIPLGVLSALRRDSSVDHAARIFALGGVTVPVFWLGLLAQLLFYGTLGILPAGGRLNETIEVLTPVPTVTHFLLVDAVIAENWWGFRDALVHLILPVAVLAYAGVAHVTRITRASVLEVLHENYVRTAHAMGIQRRRVIWKHVLKNALIPILTTVGLAFGNALRGSFLVESIFDWPGIGRYAVLAILRLDYMAIIGVAIVATITYVLVNLVVDLLYVRVDPRIRV
jgi:peptide/nickel transport system permease protein